MKPKGIEVEFEWIANVLRVKFRNSEWDLLFFPDGAMSLRSVDGLKLEARQISPSQIMVEESS